MEYDPEAKGAPLTLTLKDITQEASNSGLYLKSGTLGFSGNMECLNYNRLYVQGGTLDAAGPLQFLSGSGLIMSSGTLLQGSTMQFDLGSSLNMTGGLIQVDDILTVNSSSVSISKGTIQINGTLTGTGVIIMGGFSPFEVLSLIGDEAVLNMTGGGTIGIGAFSTIHISGTFTNQGSASLGGFLSFSNCTFNNTGSIQTTGFGGGAFEAEAGTNALINWGSFQASSSPNGEPMAIKIPFVNKSGGTLTWDGAAFHDTVTNETGAFIVGQNIDINGGTLMNQGQITAGATDMNGNLSMSETSSLVFQGEININGNAALDGNLNFEYNSNNLAAGDTFQLMTFGSRTGSFASENLPQLPDGLLWNVVYSDTRLKLEVLSTDPVTWKGAGENFSWTDPANWDPELIPGPGDDLAFPDAPAPYTVEVSSDLTVKSVRLNEKVILNFKLGGTTAGDADDQHDQLTVTKGITLGGSTLQVTLTNGFVPALGDSFTLITHGRRFETFGAEILPTLADGLSWQINYEPINSSKGSNIVLMVLSTPSIRWDGGGDGISWSDAANWSENRLPVETDNVLLPELGETYKVMLQDTLSIHALTLQQSVDFTISSGLLTCTGEVNVGAGSFFRCVAGFQTDSAFTVLGGGYLIIDGDFVHNGALQATENSKLYLQNTGTFLSNGKLTMDAEIFQVSNGTLQINDTADGSGQIVFVSGTLSGSGTLNLTDPGYVMIYTNTTLQGDLTNQGRIRWEGGGGDVLWNDATLTNQGELFCTGSTSGNMIPAGGTNLFINSGTVTGTNATRNFGVPFINREGVVKSWTGNPGTIGFTSSLVNEVNGSFQGIGTLDVSNADFTNHGITNPDTSNGQFTVGILKVTGDYPMGATSTLNVEIAGITPGDLHDQLDISGSAALGGTLNLSLISDYMPALGDTFEIVRYTSHTGTFANSNLPVLGEGLSFQVQYTDAGVTLEVLIDSDGDGISDADEEAIYNTFPDDPDSDDDGLDDGDELAYWGAAWNADPDGDQLVNLLDPDSDNDGILDGQEVQLTQIDPDLNITEIFLAGGEVVLRLPSSIGKSYQLRHRDTLNTGDWVPEGAALSGTGAILEFRPSAVLGSYDRQFYDVLVSDL